MFIRTNMDPTRKGVIRPPWNLSITVGCFQTLDAVFPKDLFSDYVEITIAVVVQCRDPKKYPRISI